jgi:hypothetical protein
MTDAVAQAHGERADSHQLDEQDHGEYRSG